MRLGIGMITAAIGMACAACSTGMEPILGEEDGPCYPNGACHSGLTCVQQVCVDSGFCSLGAIQVCACADGSFGVQHCDGWSGWYPCECSPECGDGICGSEETADTCPQDCPGTPCGGVVCELEEICFDGSCLEEWPACYTHSDPQYDGWPDDSDLEPNGMPDLAVTMPCGQDPGEDPEYYQRCPNRESYTNGFMNLVICPAGEADLYKIFLLDGERLEVQLFYQYSDDPPRNLDLVVLHWDDPSAEYLTVAEGTSTTDNESIVFEVDLAGPTPPGWYYLKVYGALADDLNFYTIATTLNPSP